MTTTDKIITGLSLGLIAGAAAYVAWQNRRPAYAGPVTTTPTDLSSKTPEIITESGSGPGYWESIAGDTLGRVVDLAGDYAESRLDEDDEG